MYEPLCCERVEILLGDFLEGALSWPLHLRVESHLVVCVECWREVQKMRCVIACLSELPRIGMPAELKEVVLAAS